MKKAKFIWPSSVKLGSADVTGLGKRDSKLHTFWNKKLSSKLRSEADLQRNKRERNKHEPVH